MLYYRNWYTQALPRYRHWYTISVSSGTTQVGSRKLWTCWSSVKRNLSWNAQEETFPDHHAPSSLLTGPYNHSHYKMPQWLNLVTQKWFNHVQQKRFFFTHLAGFESPIWQRPLWINEQFTHLGCKAGRNSKSLGKYDRSDEKKMSIAPQNLANFGSFRWTFLTF